MRKDYEIQGQKVRLEVEIEKEVVEIIQLMSNHTKLSTSEIANTALKRFISGHKDFLPPKKL